MVALLAADISIFGADSILGASQVALMLAGGVCIGLSHEGTNSGLIGWKIKKISGRDNI